MSVVVFTSFPEIWSSSFHCFYMTLVKNEEGGSYTYFSGSDIVQGGDKGFYLAYCNVCKLPHKRKDTFHIP